MRNILTFQLVPLFIVAAFGVFCAWTDAHACTDEEVTKHLEAKKMLDEINQDQAAIDHLIAHKADLQAKHDEATKLTGNEVDHQ